MSELTVSEIKAFVPARDYALSKRFYQDMGFTLASDYEGIAYFHHGNCSFLLQDIYIQTHAENFMMHLLVDDVQAWWQQLERTGFAQIYGLQLSPPVARPWGITDFVVIDPSGVLWRIGQNTTGFAALGQS
ncbi:MAG: VOC family protein [Pseudomonadota bacterium]